MNEHGDTKRLIQDAARRLVTEGGVQKFSMRKLSQETGLSPGTIYYHYPSKSDLIVELVDELWVQCFEDLPSEEFTGFQQEFVATYDRLLEHFLQFQHNWLRELSTLSALEKKSGRQYEENYMILIRQRLLDMVQKHRKQISADAMECLGEEGMVEFLFINMMYYLRRGQSDTKNLLYIVNKILEI